MDTPSEPTLSPELEAFSKGIETLQRRHQQVAAALCAERLMRDAQPLQRHRPRLGDIAQSFWMRLLTAHDRVQPVRESPITARVIVIDAATGAVQEEVNND